MISAGPDANTPNFTVDAEGQERYERAQASVPIHGRVRTNEEFVKIVG